MSARQLTLLSLVESFFRNYLVQNRGASPHTICAYRDTLRMLFTCIAQRQRRPVANITLDDLNVETVSAFLEYLEKDRCNSVTTRNVRLAAIHSFFRHLVANDLTRGEQYQRVLSIPNKRAPVSPPNYLEADDVKRLLAEPAKSTAAGRRDYALMLFLYNTGARISEALELRVENLSLSPLRRVRLFGKRSKVRFCPLWRETARALAQLPAFRDGRPTDRVFCNRAGDSLTRDGAAYLIRKYATLAARKWPALRNCRITPHVLRHSCAVALLQAGVDITVIRDYLGHASIATTNRYVQANMDMKRDALNRYWRKSGLSPSRTRRWVPKSDVLAYLESI